ncbi:Protein bfr2 [Lachnellula suecica]|uniref:Protein BFR2 n=1 Tax=Lachnellula suecica TaxID=602035 RepID=A0A8T9BWQ8_9HELO|nr:Protein bfr2 [Lachnellula suecica]
MAKSKSRAQQFAAMSLDPVPKDFDPEEDIPDENSNDSASEDSDDGLAGTEHYAQVGKSKLRKVEEVALGPKYAGSRISRDQLIEEDDDELHSDADASDLEEENNKFADPDDLEFDVDDDDGDIDSDAAFGESDSEKFKKFTFRGSGKPPDVGGNKKRPTASDFMSESEDEDAGAALDGSEDETDEDLMDTAEQHSENSENEIFSTARQFPEQEDTDDDIILEASQGEDGSEGGDEDDEMESVASEDAPSDDGSETRHGDDQKAELQKMMQTNAVAAISQAAKAEADKGVAVRQQRKAFDSFLSVRMVLQKALVATNSMAVSEEKDSDDSENQPYEAAEEAAIKLWNTLDRLRHDLSNAKNGAKTGQKRKRDINISTSSDMIWDRMEKAEAPAIATRHTILDKWSEKTRTSAEGPIKKKSLSQTQNAPQSLTSILKDQIANSDHLVKKTKMPRSCAPVQRYLKMVEDPNIYDDGNFYQLLLKELVDQRRVESLSAPAGAGNGGALQWTAVKEAKTRKNVDTKASKGRKMRYTVHDKLVSLMVPEDRGTWEPEAIDRFFGTLLGQKLTLGEEMDVDEDDVPLEEEGLKLFRSS